MEDDKIYQVNVGRTDEEGNRMAPEWDTLPGHAYVQGFHSTKLERDLRKKHGFGGEEPPEMSEAELEKVLVDVTKAHVERSKRKPGHYFDNIENYEG